MKTAGFEGNAQTFRILTFLSVREPVDERPGLNLTRATLDAATKYPRTRDQSVDSAKHWGAYGGLDAERLSFVRNTEPPGRNARQCFEAQLMDWCDDVAYAVHDVVDFYRSGQIPLHRLLVTEGEGSLTPETLQFLARFSQDFPNENFDDIQSAWREIAPQSDIQYPWTPTAARKAAAQSTTSRLITLFLDDVGWTERGAREQESWVYGAGEPLRYSADFVIDRSPERARLKKLSVKLLQRLIWHYVIERQELATQQHGQTMIVSGLVKIYVNDYDLLPADRREELDIHGDGIRVAVDHVASLTEAHALSLYGRLTGFNLGRFSDIL
jgi:dGTPase